MDATLLTILLLLLFATVVALIQTRRRDKCLRDFEGFYLTLAEKGGDLSWGYADIYATGLEIRYVQPVATPAGYQETSFIFYRDQFEAVDALYRYAEGLSEAQQQERRRVIEQTSHPTLGRRLLRRFRNWISILRDALMQAASLVIGAAKTRRPGSAVLSTQETQIKALSSEIIGHAGNAFDPLLERHLFKQVVLEITREGCTRSYCGWLKDYTTQFVEVLDAVVPGVAALPPRAAYAPGEAPCSDVTIEVTDGRLRLINGSEYVFHIDRVEAGDWHRPMGCVLPPGYTADLTLPPGTSPTHVRSWIGPVDRVDLIVPRTHALVRHAAHYRDTAPTV